MSIENKRIEIVDFLRGLAVVNMIIYHLFYSLVFVFDVKISFFSIPSWYPYQQYIAWSFIFLSGFSINLSKRPLLNGIKVMVAAILVTLVTYIFLQEFTIRFGILHFMSLAILLVAIFQVYLNRINPYSGLILSLVVFLYIWANGVEVFPFYGGLTKYNLFFLGFPNALFSSSDYFPLMPWFFLFLSGFFTGRLNQAWGNPIAKYKLNLPVINFLGRNSLTVYLLHQVLIFISLTILIKLGII